MKKILFALILLIFTNDLFPQIEDNRLVTCIHKYVTFQAWELIKYIHPEVEFTKMHKAMKNPVTGQYSDPMSNEFDGNKPWELGSIITGSFREDEEDPVYCYCGPFNSSLTKPHFWDADYGDYGWGYGHDVEGSNEKMKAYWTSEIPGGGGHRISVGPIKKSNGDIVSISVRYDNLANLYKNRVWGIIDYIRPYSPCNEYEWIPILGSYPLVDFFMYECGMSEDVAVKQKNKIVWEIVGRMCHLIQDMGVPAHVHNDGHPISDYYETEFLGNQQNYKYKNYMDAYNQGIYFNEDPIININNLQNPIRTITYLANQLSDRFPSDDGDGDLSFTTNTNNDDFNFIYNQLNPKYSYLSQVPTRHFGNDPPVGLMDLLLNVNYVNSIRTTAGFLWYIYNNFEIHPLADIKILEPINCWGIWNPINVNSGIQSFPCRFKIEGNSQTQYVYTVSYRKGEQIFNTFNTGVTDGNSEITVQCPLNGYPQICYNIHYDIVVRAYPSGYPIDDVEDSTTFIPYNPTSNCMPYNLVKAEINMDNFLVDTKNITFNTQGSCNGTYYAKRHKVYKQIYYNDNQVIATFVPGFLEANNTAGFNYDERNGNYSSGMKWAGIQNQTPTSAILYTYVYEIPSLPPEKRWAPCSPNDAAIVYTTTPGHQGPDISGFTPYPNKIYKLQPTTFKCNLYKGTGPVNYYFEWINSGFPMPPNLVTLTQNGGPFVTVSFNNGSPPLPGWTPIIKCRAMNQDPYTGQNKYSEKSFSIELSSNNGCPWLFIEDADTNTQMNNNLLNKSKFPEYVGQDYTDRYVLSKTPGIIDSTITLSIGETTIDTSFINSIKLYAVDYPIGSKLCVTEDNQLAIFDSASVLSVKEAYLNQEEITRDIQFHLLPRNTVQSDTLDHAYTFFDNNSFSNLGIIADLKWNPNAVSHQKNWDGFLSANLGNETFTSSFSRRENKSITAIPVLAEVMNPSISTIDIDWYKGNEIRYIALASLSYSGFAVTELSLLSAFNSSDSDEIYKVIQIDNLYSKIDFSNSLTLKFKAFDVQPYNQIRDYVIEVNGRIGSYLNPLKKEKINKLKTNKPLNSLVPFKNKLNHNYPNPFNPVTKISYSIEKQGLVNLKIYDILGREIKTLVKEIKSPGEYIVEFNGANLASGVYFYRLEVNGFTDIKKMMLIK
jgi:hypothetical protein